ncbi:PAS domain S-box protein [Candidatus Saccharibacteria bacterium]|nr:PAS domain S-box protein [Candidatus Saccharibacteria bacterium]
MQHVKVSWLRKFNYSLVGATVILFVTYFAFELQSVSQTTKDKWGITPLILALGAIHAIYVVVSDQLLVKKQPWLTSLISYALFAFLIASIIESSGNTNVYYRAAYIVSVFFTGMIGLYAPLTAIIYTWMILIFTITGIATPTNASLTFNVVADSLLTISGLAGWYYFKRYYVTGRKEVQLQSKLQEEQFKTGVILESISDGVMIINNKGTVEILNQSTADLLGWERKDAEKLDYKSLIEPLGSDEEDTVEQDAITECISKNSAVKRISLLKTHHDRQIYVDIVASPIEQEVVNADGKHSTEHVGVVAVLRDVDAQKRQEEQRSDFISTASHEMRTPVASIQGFIELALNEKVSTIDDKARGYLDKAYESTKHLGRLFQDLLTASKSDDGRLENHPELINVQEFLEATVDKERSQAEKKGLTLKLAEQKATGKQVTPLMFVHVDPERLQEVLNNLIENAIKYTKKGIITVGTSLQDQGVVIRVSDTGVGIATEDIPHLFQKFYRTDNSETREVGGTGLGLYISKQIVDSMGGHIWVESSLGNGSTFYIQIPRVSPEQLEHLKQQTTDNPKV